MRFVQSALMLDAVSWSNRLLSCVWVCCMEPESRVCGSGRDGAVVWCEGQTTGCHFHIGFAVCGWGSNPRSPRLYCKLQEWPSQNMGEEGVKRPDTLYVNKFRHVRWSLGPELCRHPVQASHIAVSVTLIWRLQPLLSLHQQFVNLKYAFYFERYFHWVILIASTFCTTTT